MNTIKINREQTRDNNRKAGAITSFLVHLVILVLMFINLFTYPDPPPGQEGIQVAFGVPDVGNNTEQPSESSETATIEEEVAQQEVEEEVEQEVVEQEVEPEPAEPEKAEVPPVKPDVPKEVITDDNSKEIALKKEKERKKRAEEARKKAEDAKKKAEAKKKADAKRKAAEAKKRAEAEKKRKAAEAKRKAEAERKRKEAEAKALKDKLSGGFKKKKDGGGKGNNGKTGNTGDPNSDNIKNNGTGGGKKGEGADVKGRSVQGKEPFNETSQLAGTITVHICVDPNGKVISASARSKTITNSAVKRKAEENARKWTFSKGRERNCGTIIYNLKVN